MTPIEYRDALPDLANTPTEADVYFDACDDAHHDRTQRHNAAVADGAHMCFPVVREDSEWARAFRASVAQVRAVRGAA